MLFYVDNIILTGNDPAFIATLVTKLGQELALKDFRILH